MTKSALSHHLNILQIATDGKHKDLSSVHNLLSKYKDLETETSKIWVCKNEKCDNVLKTAKDAKTKKDSPTFKQSCGHNYRKDDKDCYILTLSIEKQLEFFINHHGMPEPGSWNPDPNYRGDVGTGDCYRKLRDQGLLNDDWITFTVNLDGAACHEV